MIMDYTMTRDELAGHRKEIEKQLNGYITIVSGLLGLNPEPVEILEYIKSTHVRLSKKIISDEFIQHILECNEQILKGSEKKKFLYDVEFCQSRTGCVDVKTSAPLLIDGLGRMGFFFRELKQHIERAQEKEPASVIPIRKEFKQTSIVA